MKSHEETREFNTGAVRDGGKKPLMHLISPHLMNRLGEWLRVACEDRKPPYPERNWEQGFPFSTVVGSLQRHIEAFKLGDTSEDHLAAGVFNLMALTHFEEEIKAGRMSAELDDMPHYATPKLGDVRYTNGYKEIYVQFVSASPVKEGEALFHDCTITHKEEKKPFTVYLCGPISGKEIDSNWRRDIKNILLSMGITTLDPLRGKKTDLISDKGMGYNGELADPTIADRDVGDIKEADLIFAHFPYTPERQSIGSLMEMGMAHALGKPIVLLAGIDEFNKHLFCRRFCHIVPDLTAAVEAIYFYRDVRDN